MYTKTQLENMRKEIKDALASIAEKYNSEIGDCKIKYNIASTTFIIDFNTKGSNGISAEQNLFNLQCENYGFKPTDYQKPIIIDNKTYYLVGFNPKARKNFCVIENCGKRYTCSVETVRSN